MNKKNDPGHLPGKGQRGVIIIIVAISLFVLIGIGALAIDIGYLATTRSELQNVADAAALAGARYLGEVYEEEGRNSFSSGEVYDVVQEVAGQNKAANTGITIRTEDVLIGRWDVEQSDEDIWLPTLVDPDAVRVIARRDGSSANGPISTFLARVFNINTMNVESKRAIAALSGPSWVDEGELKTPFGLSENVFPNDCKDVIAFSPTTDSCAGWHNFFDKMDANRLEEKLLGLIQGHTDCDHCGSSLLNGPNWLAANFNINKTPDSEETPLTSTGDEFQFKGGTISSMFLGGYLTEDYDTGTDPGNRGAVEGNEKKPAPMIALFDYFRYRDGDGDDSIWTATIPVYKDSSNDCMNPNTSLEIVGFAQIEIKTADPPPLSSLKVKVYCDLVVIEGRSGGTTYGNLRGTIPNLVR